MENEELKDILTQVSIFKGMNSTQIALLANVFYLKEYNIGEQILREGATGDGLYIVVEGKLNKVRTIAAVSTFPLCTVYCAFR